MNIILFREGECVLRKGDERFDHIKRILHMREGDSFKAGIINGMQGTAKIEKMDDDEISLSFSFIEDGSKLYPLTLIIAQVRPICMKRILRETVSLGAGHLILPVSDLGEKSYLSSSLYQREEYKDILLDGAMQAGFTGIPRAELTSSLESAISLDDSDEKILLDNVIGSVPLSSLPLEGRSVTLVIGPERGWSERERKLLLSSGYRPCLLGSRILRTETASSAAAAVALSRMGLL